MWRRRVLLVAFTAILGHAVAAAAAGCRNDERGAADEHYRQGLAEYRGGRPDAAYPLLLAALTSCPDDPSYRNDFIVAAVGAGHPDMALGIGTPLDSTALPTYVLEALARAARDLHREQVAIRYYDVILAKGENVGASVGRNLALIDAGAAAQAQHELLALTDRYPNRIDILEALGLADEALGEVIPALAAAEQALNLAEPDRLILPFAMTGARQLLEALPPHGTSHAALVTDILDAIRGPGRGGLRQPVMMPVEELSRSELRVLRYLPTNLTRREIAGELSVSQNTVDTHIRRIYAKLGAADRSAAVKRGRELRLLSVGRA